MRTKPSDYTDKAEMEMTPMIDVTFLLLIFFICTLKFKTLEGRLAAYLPKDVGLGTQQSVPPDDIEVQLTVITPGTRLEPRGGAPWSELPGTRYTFAADREITYHVGPRRYSKLSQVAERLSELHQAAPQRKAVLAPGAGIVHDEVVKVLDRVLNSGISEVRLQGAP